MPGAAPCRRLRSGRAGRSRHAQPGERARRIARRTLRRADQPGRGRARSRGTMVRPCPGSKAGQEGKRAGAPPSVMQRSTALSSGSNASKSGSSDSRTARSTTTRRPWDFSLVGEKRASEVCGECVWWVGGSHGGCGEQQPELEHSPSPRTRVRAACLLPHQVPMSRSFCVAAASPGFLTMSTQLGWPSPQRSRARRCSLIELSSAQS